MTLQLVGTRSPATDTTAGSGGSVYKNVETDGYTLLDFNAKNYSGLVDAEGTTELFDIEIGDGVIDNIDRVFTHSAAPSIRDIYIHDLKCTNLERGLGDVKVADHVLLERITCQQQKIKTTKFSDAWSTSDVRTDDIEVRDVVMDGFRMFVPVGDYPNGGAFSDEEKSTHAKYLRCIAKNGNDGWDVKSIDALLDRCQAISNRRNFRWWGPNATATDCISAFVAADYQKTDPDGRTDARPNAHHWFDSGRMAGCTLIRPRFGDVAGSTVPYLKIEGGADVGAIVRVVDPMDLDGNVIPRATFMARVSQTDDGKTDVTVVVEYTGKTKFDPIVDLQPHAPIITALGGVTPPPPVDPTPEQPPVVTPPPPAGTAPGVPTGATAVLNADNTITIKATAPAGAATVECYEALHGSSGSPRVLTPVNGVVSYTTGVKAVGTSYKYQLRSVSSDGLMKSAYVGTSPSTINVTTAPPAAPTPVPTTVAAVVTPGDARATVAWQLSVGNDGANGVKVSRGGVDSAGAGAYAFSNLLATEGSVIFTKLVNDTAYPFTVQPTKDGVNVGTPTTVSGTPKSAVAPPSEEPVDPQEPDTTEVDELRERVAELEALSAERATALANLQASYDHVAEHALNLEGQVDRYIARQIELHELAQALLTRIDDQV